MQVGEEVERALAKFAPPKVGGIRYVILKPVRNIYHGFFDFAYLESLKLPVLFIVGLSQ